MTSALSPDLSPDSPPVLERLGAVLAARLGGDGAPVAEGVISGNINAIVKLRYGGQMLGARLALNTYRFRYEKDIIKEIFALFLITYARDAENDQVARGIVDGILASPSGGHVGHGLVRRVLHYDWSMEALPWPFFIFEWVDGEILWNAPSADLYAEAGRNLAKLHRIGFQAHYRDIFRIGREPLAWADRFGRALAEERAQAAERLPAPILAKLDAITPTALPPAPPVLVHNDYSGGNIIVDSAGGQKIVDWDNWVVEAPELDLLKMKYWTAIGADGLLGPVPALYSAFLEGYKSAAGSAVDERRLRACEALWLTRAFNFESARVAAAERRSGGSDLALYYPPAARYRDWLTDL